MMWHGVKEATGGGWHLWVKWACRAEVATGIRIRVAWKEFRRKTGFGQVDREEEGNHRHCSLTGKPGIVASPRDVCPRLPLSFL